MCRTEGLYEARWGWVTPTEPWATKGFCKDSVKAFRSQHD